ncbi:hypothetical protein FLX56_10010 [Synechococcus moorigangaii CMS01]|nr:hypothetical protein [Synechococcus moorigangaii CMS01]
MMLRASARRASHELGRAVALAALRAGVARLTGAGTVRFVPILRHSRVDGNPEQHSMSLPCDLWAPACAGATTEGCCVQTCRNHSGPIPRHSGESRNPAHFKNNWVPDKR